MSARTYTVYLLRCADGSLYAGITNDLPRRLLAHNAGKGAKYTRARLPVALAWQRSRQEPRAARQLERALKSLRRAEKERLVAGDLALWRRIRRESVTPPALSSAAAVLQRRPTRP